MEESAHPATTASEPCLVGLSPSYWANVPMSIADIHQMKVVGGVPCLVIRRQSSSFVECFPISKCCLVGTIVMAKQKRYCVQYVIDDGTGFMDCVEWGDCLMALPPLVGTTCTTLKCGEYAVGDQVRILGRIKCLSVSETKQDLVVENGSTVEARDCIAEIQVNEMEHLSTFDNEEANHWIKGILATRRATKDGSSRGLRNGMDTLKWLGPKIRNDVQQRRHFPSASDALEAWRVFSEDCTCKLPYKEALLYCHCKATTIQANAEPLDPNLVYRGALLEWLLNQEATQQQPNQDFRFQYKTLAEDKELCKVARQVVAKTKKPSANAGILLRATFGALQDDGILSLLDAKSDTYLLVSRKNVLEPCVQRCLQRRQPPCANVPRYLGGDEQTRQRLQYIQRCLEAAEC